MCTCAAASARGNTQRRQAGTNAWQHSAARVPKQIAFLRFFHKAVWRLTSTISASRVASSRSMKYCREHSRHSVCG